MYSSTRWTILVLAKGAPYWPSWVTAQPPYIRAVHVPKYGFGCNMNQINIVYNMTYMTQGLLGGKSYYRNEL